MADTRNDGAQPPRQDASPPKSMRDAKETRDAKDPKAVSRTKPARQAKGPKVLAPAADNPVGVMNESA